MLNCCIRCSYSNNTLVVPPREPFAEPEGVACIMYFSDPSAGGTTGIVTNRDVLEVVGEQIMPRTYAVEGPRGADSTERPYGIRADNKHPLYSRAEHALEYRPGTVLLYRFDTFHRGTPVNPLLPKGQGRFTLHVGLRRARAEWTSMHATVIRNGSYPKLFIGGLSPHQRSVIHYPLPGHPYFTRETIRLVAERYEGFDPAPYLAAVVEVELPPTGAARL